MGITTEMINKKRPWPFISGHAAFGKYFSLPSSSEKKKEEIFVLWGRGGRVFVDSRLD